MKQIVCEMCGGTDLIKDEGVFVCQNCGCKYTVEEAKRMMIEGTVDVQGTVKIDNTEQINNYIALAKNAEDRNNEAEAESYANRALEIDPNNSKALYIKGVSAGWQSSLKNNRLDETICCFEKALECCCDEEKDKLKQEISASINKLWSGMIDLCCNQFENSPGNETADTIKSEVFGQSGRILNLLESCDASVKFYEAFIDNIASQMTSAATKAWDMTWRDYTDGLPFQPDGSSHNVRLEHLRYCHPTLQDFNLFLKRAIACTAVYKYAILLDKNGGNKNIDRYNNLLFIASKVLDARCISYISGTQLTSAKWVTDYPLANKSKVAWRNMISEWKEEIKKIEDEASTSPEILELKKKMDEATNTKEFKQYVKDRIEFMACKQEENQETTKLFSSKKKKEAAKRKADEAFLKVKKFQESETWAELDKWDKEAKENGAIVFKIKIEGGINDKDTAINIISSWFGMTNLNNIFSKGGIMRFNGLLLMYQCARILEEYGISYSII